MKVKCSSSHHNAPCHSHLEHDFLVIWLLGLTLINCISVDSYTFVSIKGKMKRRKFVFGKNQKPLVNFSDELNELNRWVWCAASLAVSEFVSGWVIALFCPRESVVRKSKLITIIIYPQFSVWPIKDNSRHPSGDTNGDNNSNLFFRFRKSL